MMLAAFATLFIRTRAGVYLFVFGGYKGACLEH